MDSIIDRNAEAAYGPQAARWDGSGYLHIEAPGMRAAVVQTDMRDTDYMRRIRQAQAERMDESAAFARDMLNY